MPVDLVLVRHAESEGCLAHERSKVPSRRCTVHTVPSSARAELEANWCLLAVRACVCADSMETTATGRTLTSATDTPAATASPTRDAARPRSQDSGCVLPPICFLPPTSPAQCHTHPTDAMWTTCRSRRTCRRSSIGTSAASTCALWKRRRCSILTTPIGTPVPCCAPTRTHPYPRNATHHDCTPDFFLRERDRGILSNLSRSEVRTRHQEELAREELDPFYHAPPGYPVSPPLQHAADPIRCRWVAIDGLYFSWPFSPVASP
jgi:hypothetical protein